MGREFDSKFLKKVKSPPHALPPRPAGRTLIGALSLARNILFTTNKSKEPPHLLWRLKQVVGTNLIPLRTKLDTLMKEVPAWPVINQLCFPERHFWANGISICLSKVQMKVCERLCSSDGFCRASKQEARAHVTCRLANGNLEWIRWLFSNL